jgi:hypothetical protein
MKPLFLFVGGVSGSGKSFLANILINEDLEQCNFTFKKLKQVTTRKPRPNESPMDPDSYYFINDVIYDTIKDSILFARTKVNGENYGTLIPKSLVENTVYVVVVNEEGLLDGKLALSSIYSKNDINVISLGIDVKDKSLYNEFRKFPGRERRNFFEEEKVLSHCDLLIDYKEYISLTPREIKKKVIEMIEEKTFET